MPLGIPKPKKKHGGLWLVIPKVTNCLPSKEFPCRGKPRSSLIFLPSEKQERTPIPSISVCDSYMGCDQEYSFAFDVREIGAIKDDNGRE
ncbi:unnamed protein product [Camellia sinensis]